MSFTNMYFIEYNLATAAAVIQHPADPADLRHAAEVGGAGGGDERAEGVRSGPH
jgi:hypothetical protein